MNHVFDPDVLQRIVQGSLDLPREEAMDSITQDLHAAYPGHIDTGPRDWIFNNAGGAMGQLTLLYASLNEYLIFFGTPIGTEGHSGRYRTDVYDVMFDGEMWCYIEGESERSVYKPGDMAFLGKDLAKGYRVHDRAWMLEYARGPIYTMLPFGLADSMVSTLDLRSFRRTLQGYAKCVMQSFRGPRTA